MSYQTVIVLDFGGQYKELIARRVRECGVYSVILPGDTPLERIRELVTAARALCPDVEFVCEDITRAVIGEEKIVSRRKYHTLTEAKNGAGAVPIKTDRGWIHIAHGVRNTA